MNKKKEHLLATGRNLDFVGRANRQRKARVIEIDTHEDLDRLTELLLTGMGYTVRRRLLPLGDFQWDTHQGRCIIERKTPADARDLGRLLAQITRLREAARAWPTRDKLQDAITIVILLIDHRKEWRDNPNYSAWDDHAFDNLLVSIAGIIRIAHCEQGQLAHRLDSLYQWSQKHIHSFTE